jgi:hypothetical protein
MIIIKDPININDIIEMASNRYGDQYGRKEQKGRFPMLRELCLNRCEFAEAYLNKDTTSLAGKTKR